ATAQEIARRVIIPFNQVLDAVDDGRERVLLGIPGNHDWYDGLDGFARMFRRQIDADDSSFDLQGSSGRPLRQAAEWAREFVRGGQVEKPKALVLNGYRRVQGASYFALPLTPSLHLFGVDRQLKTLDPQQIQFFETWLRAHPSIVPWIML